MRRASILYFSGTGNTRRCAWSLGKALARRGFGVRIASIEAAPAERLAPLLAEADLPVLGYPIYGSDMPDPMKAFLRSLPVRPGDGAFRDAAVFCTQWLFSGDGAALADEELLPRGFRARWTAHARMPNDLCLSVLRLPYTNEEPRLSVVGARADRRMEALAEAAATGGSFARGRGLLSRPLGLIQRAPFRRLAPRYRAAVGVDRGRCSLCGLCLRLCPVENLHKAADSIKAAGRCIFCMRCYDFCPRSAVTFFGQAHDLRRGPPYRGPEPGFEPGILRIEDASLDPEPLETTERIS